MAVTAATTSGRRTAGELATMDVPQAEPSTRVREVRSPRSSP
jgi:hypothetical protein